LLRRSAPRNDSLKDFLRGYQLGNQRRKFIK